MPPGGASPIDCRTIFAGKVGAVDTTNAMAVLSVDDYRDLLSMSMPRHASVTTVTSNPAWRPSIAE